MSRRAAMAVGLLVATLTLGLLNAFLRPLLMLLSLPLLALGLYFIVRARRPE